jgi:hypothetical protein
LAVEQQFYLVWPLVVKFLLHGRSQRMQLGLMLLFAALSVTVGQGWSAQRSTVSWGYYLLPSRLGEFLLGALVARSGLHLSSVLRELAGALGVLLLMGCAWLYSSSTVYPGLSVLIPCGATMLVMLGGAGNTGTEPQKETLVNWMLAQPLLVWLGNISYSVYLIHWMLFAFLRYLAVDLEGIHGVSAVGYTFALAYASVKYIETPFRKSKRGFGVVFLTLVVLPAVLMSCGAILTIETVAVTKAIAVENAGTMERNVTLPMANQNFKYHKILLVGDSHVGHYHVLLSELGKRAGFEVIKRTSKGCPPFFWSTDLLATTQWGSACMVEMPAFLKDVEQSEVVALTAQYHSYMTAYPWNGPSVSTADRKAALESTVDRLLAMKKTVILLAQISYFDGFRRNCPPVILEKDRASVSLGDAPCVKTHTWAEIPITKENELLLAVKEKKCNVYYWDVNPYICPQGVCSPYFKTGEKLYLDDTHLTKQGALLVASTIPELPWPIKEALSNGHRA